MPVKTSQSSIILTNEEVKNGIFFRNPFFKREFDIYETHYNILNDTPTKGCIHATHKFKGLWGKIHAILNSQSKVLRTIKWMSECDNAALYRLNSIRSLIYFSRIERSAEYIDEDLVIKSKGFHYVDEACGGACVKEFTKIYRVVGDKTKLIKSYYSHSTNSGHKGYKMTYKHVLIDFVKDAVIK